MTAPAGEAVGTASGRVNLIGEHTDYNEGFVLPMALDRTVTVRGRVVPGPSRIAAADLGEIVLVDLTGPLAPRPGCFSNYVVGVVNELMAAGAPPVNLAIEISGTVPVGAGLGSSAALEVATARMLAELHGLELDPIETARLCQRAEHAFAGTPCGIMDQLVAVLAPVGEAVLIDCRSLETRPVRLPKEAAVLVADTGVRHALSGTEYARRRRTCEAVAAILDVPALRDADVAMIESAGLTDEQRRRARHVVEENRRTLEAAEALEAGDLAAAGRLMRASHDSLRDLYEVSCPELDALVEAADTLARDGVAVHGARLTGGGFGGCVVILCDSEAANTVRKSLGGNVLQMSI